MFLRTLMLCLLITLPSSGVASVTRNHKDLPSRSPNRPITLSTTRVKKPAGRTVINLKGHYQRENTIVTLTAITVKDAHRTVARKDRRKLPEKAVFSQSSIRMSGQRFAAAPQRPAPIEGDGDPGYDYYHSEGRMTKSDGTMLVDAIYHYDGASNQNAFYLTLGGVNFSFDLNTQQQLYPVSDAQVDQVEAWLNSSDGLLVRETGVALVQQGQQQPANEALLTYYLIAMIVGDNSTTQSALDIRSRRKDFQSHHALVPTQLLSLELKDSCPAVGAPVNKSLLAKMLLPAAPQCFGGCGPGCYVIPNRWGVPIYGPPCVNHDQCVGNNGGTRLTHHCWPQLAVAIWYVIYRW
jgi:hypothetical protein